MKAASRLLSAASAVALSAGLIVSGSFAFQLAGVSVADAAVVSRVEVRGNARMDADTVRSYVNIQPGQNFSNVDVDNAVKRLFDTGLFSDVRITQSGSTLVVTVVENAIVNQVLFQGNRKIKDADLQRQVQLRPRGPMSTILLESDAQTVRDAYSRIGRDDAVVSTQVVDLGEGRVNVVFNIEEGGRTKIADIRFEGNSAYTDGRLRGVISTKESSFLSFLLRNDIYDDNRLRVDEEALRRFYFNRGYADFQIVSAVAELDEATNDYTITFTVSEGDRYRFGPIEVESTIEGVDPNALRSLVESRQGDWYSAEDVEDSIVAITERVATEGYAFAEVTPRGNRNFEDRTISVVYTVDQGARAYVERIEIRGNTRTRDYVIRREFDVSEGDAFNQVLVQRAKKRLERLDFFTTVNISSVPGSQPDQVILVVDVIEKSTGELGIGGGYTTGDSATSGFSVEGSISERNFLGRGQSIRLSVAGGRNSRDYMFSFTEPYFLGSRISAGFDIFRQTRSYNNYETKLTGGSVRFGLPITEALSTQFAYNYTSERYNFTPGCDENEDGTIDPGPPRECGISDILADAIENQSPWTKSSVSGAIIFNTIDDLRNPREGIYANFTTEVAGLGGDARWVKLTGRGSYYHTLVEDYDIVAVLSGGAGHIIGDDNLRVFDMFQSDDRLIRGFKYNGIGPYDFRGGRQREHLGGTTYFNASAELQFPLPVIPEGFGMRGAIFADAATLYGNDLDEVGNSDIRGKELAWRASVGAGLIWASPFGPLRVNYALPVVKEDSDLVQNFSFGVSTRF